MAADVHKCCLCGRTFFGWGNNPEPLASFEERCCDGCNATEVIPARIRDLKKRSSHW